MAEVKCADCKGNGGFSSYHERYGDVDYECDSCEGTGVLRLNPDELKDYNQHIKNRDSWLDEDEIEAETQAEQESERNAEALMERWFERYGYTIIPF